MFLLQNAVTGQLAAADCAGQHDGRFTNDLSDAKMFASYGAAAEYGANFDDNWQPVGSEISPPHILAA